MREIEHLASYQRRLIEEFLDFFNLGLLDTRRRRRSNADDEAGHILLAEWHEHAAARLGSLAQIARQAICERLHDVNWNRDFGKHSFDYRTMARSLEESARRNRLAANQCN